MRKIKSGSNKIKSGVIKQTIPPNFQKAFIQQVEKKREEVTIENLNITHAKGIVEGLLKAFAKWFPKIDFYCIPKYNKYIKYIKTYSAEFLRVAEKRGLDLSQKIISLECWKLYDLEEKISKNKNTGCITKTTKDIGVYNSTLQFFEFIDNTYEILNKLLIIHFYKTEESKLLKYIRTYCLKLSEFFIKELESDRRLAV